jgi:hypothetical protein
MINHTIVFQGGKQLIVSDKEPNPNVFALLQKKPFSEVRKGIAVAREGFVLLDRFGILYTLFPRENDKFWVKRL